MTSPPPPSPPTRKPWPMSAVAAAIVVFIVGYTAVNIYFRRPEPPHEPWAEAEQRRAELIRKASLDWTVFISHLETAATVPSLDVATVNASPAPADLGAALPRDLVVVLPGKPSLYPAPERVVAPASLAASDALRVRLDFVVNTATPRFGEVLALARQRHVWLFLQDAQHVARGATPLDAAPAIDIVLPETALEPGNWRASLYTQQQVFAWEFTVTAADAESPTP